MDADPRVLPGPAGQVRRAGYAGLLALLLGATRAVPLAGQAGGTASPPADSTHPPHDPSGYEITLVTSDTGAHVLAEVQTGWRLRSVDPVEMRLDSALRVVRVLVDGKPNTRLSRTMYARAGQRGHRPAREGAGRHARAPGCATTGSRAAASGSAPTAPARARSPARPRAVGLGSGCRFPDGSGGRVQRPVEHSGGAGPARGGQRHAGEGRHPRVRPHDLALPARDAGAARRARGGGRELRGDDAAAGDLRGPVRARDALDRARRLRGGGACVPPSRRDGGFSERLSRTVPLSRARARGRRHSRRPGAPAASVVLWDEARVHAGDIGEDEIARATAAQWLGNAVSESGPADQRPSPALAAYLAWLWDRKAGGNRPERAGTHARGGRHPPAPPPGG